MSLFPIFNKANAKANNPKAALNGSNNPTTNNVSTSPAITVNASGTLTNGNLLANGSISNNSINANQWANVTVGTTCYTGPGYQPADHVAKEYFKVFINNHFSDRSYEFRDRLFQLFSMKIFEEIHKTMVGTFSPDGVEFLKEMSDEEIINYLKITE